MRLTAPGLARRRSVAGQQHGEPAALALVRLHGHAPAVRQHQRPHDGQAETGAAAADVRLPVRLEHVGGSSAAGMPMPVSSTCSSHSGPASTVRRTTCPPVGVKRTALATRLTTTCTSRSSSPVTTNFVPTRSRRSVIPASSAWGRSSSAARDDDPLEIHRHLLDREQPRAQPRDVEDLIDQPQQPVGSSVR